MATSPHVLSVRLTREQYKRVLAAAERNQQTLSDFSRVLLSNMEIGADRAADAVVAEILKLLDLPADTTAETLQAVIGELLRDLEATEPDPAQATAEGAEKAPPATGLSKLELAACAKRGLDPREYAARKRNAVRRVGGAPAATAPAPAPATSLSKAELAACKKRGIDPKDFAARKRSAARRI